MQQVQIPGIARCERCGRQFNAVAEDLKCPDCGKEIRLFGESGIDAVADELGVPVLGKLPLDPDYAKRADLGIFSAISQEQLSAGMECLKKL